MEWQEITDQFQGADVRQPRRHYRLCVTFSIPTRRTARHDNKKQTKTWRRTPRPMDKFKTNKHKRKVRATSQGISSRHHPIHRRTRFRRTWISDAWVSWDAPFALEGEPASSSMPLAVTSSISASDGSSSSERPRLRDAFGVSGD